jgi:tight adherence protein B
MNILWLSLILFGLACFLLIPSKKGKVKNYFPAAQTDDEGIDAINFQSLIGKKRWSEFKHDLSPTIEVLGPRGHLISIVYIILSVWVSYLIIFNFLTLNSYLYLALLACFLIFTGYQYLKNKRRRSFEQTFPDALNILMSAVTAGESLMQAFCFVGDNMSGEIGRQFKDMGERLKLGENAEHVLKRSCRAFPYPEYIFFTITIRANLSRGGQLKGVLARLIRVLVDARTMEMKKMAMTSEARISAKVVAAIPIIFVLIISQIHPANIDFILNDPAGRWILYYVVGSEVLGLFIVWLLVKRVKL